MSALSMLRRGLLATPALGLSAAAAQTPTATATETITVQGSTTRPHLARHVGLGALGARSAFDTPFSLSVVSAQTVQKRQAADINDIFRAEPGVQENSNGGSTASGASFRVRGLNLDWTNGYRIDGFAIPYWFIDLPTANFGQFQLVRGASAFLYGFGAPGAVLDFQLKKPVDAPLLALEAGYRSDAVFRQSIDAGGPIGAGRVDTRFVAFNEVGNQVNGSYLHTVSLNGGFDARLTDKLHWHADAFWLSTLQAGMVNGVTVVPTLTRLTPISGRAELGAADSWKRNDLKHINTGFDLELGGGWHAELAYAYTHLDERFPSNAITFLDDRGDYLNRPFQMTRVFTYHQVRQTVSGHVMTGALHHDIVGGATWLYQLFDADANATYYRPYDYGNIHVARPVNTNAHAYNPRLYHYIDYTQISPFLSDSISWRRFSLLAGARYTDYRENDYATDGSGRRTAARRNHPLTPVVSLSWRPEQTVNIYFSFVQAMQSGTQAAATARNAYEVFAPMRSAQYELGLKVQKPRWTATVAAYRLDTIAAYVDATNTQRQGGSVRYQGIEAAGTVQATRALSVSASLTWLDARYGAGTPYDGRRAESTSPFEANLSMEYALPAIAGLGGLSVDGGFGTVAGGWLDPGNRFRLQPYLIGRIGVQHVSRLGRRRLILRAAIENLGNERYWVSRGALQLFPGAPRTATLAARVEF